MNNTAAFTGFSAPFNIQVKQKDNTRIVSVASLLILLTALIACLSNAVYKHDTIIISCSSAFIVLAIWWLYAVFNKRNLPVGAAVITAITAVYFFVQANGLGILMGAMLSITLWFDNRLKRRHSIAVSAEGVTVNAFFSASIAWAQLNNVIIKDGLLTVDTKTNRLIQKELATELPAEYEAKINEFCRLHLK